MRQFHDLCVLFATCLRTTKINLICNNKIWTRFCYAAYATRISVLPVLYSQEHWNNLVQFLKTYNYILYSTRWGIITLCVSLWNFILNMHMFRSDQVSTELASRYNTPYCRWYFVQLFYFCSQSIISSPQTAMMDLQSNSLAHMCTWGLSSRDSNTNTSVRTRLD